MSEKQKLFIKAKDGISIVRNTSEGKVEFVDGIAKKFTDTQALYFIGFSKNKYVLVDEDGLEADAPLPENEQELNSAVETAIEEVTGKLKAEHESDINGLKESHTVAVRAKDGEITQLKDEQKGVIKKLGVTHAESVDKVKDALKDSEAKVTGLKKELKAAKEALTAKIEETTPDVQVADSDKK